MKGVVQMVKIFYYLQMNEYFWPKFTQDEILCEYATDIKLVLGHQIKKYRPPFLSSEIIRGDKIGV